ncbi:Tbpip [Giardia duodenalis assemblage B]|uniref:Tbpip n=1 Tax=Giardia duodenalis assemblage B TaxID=1394984 RepID=A0A132NM29_GIAIN|nr:Tbpip [Giardia intestinalis assemblage B]
MAPGRGCPDHPYRGRYIPQSAYLECKQSPPSATCIPTVVPRGSISVACREIKA